ncbi:MAG: hypothetical protein E7179_01835 [Erysipelotrichaceae bacterium]|jgi:hypothetical protein|nr:hypothetical protein [Erysipelotrichaceae bacterium]
MKYQEMLAFASFLNKVEGNDTPEWKETLRSVNELMEVMGPYQLQQGDGSYRPITPEAYRRIDEVFDKAVNSVNAYVKGQPAGPEDVRMPLMKNFSKEFLSKSYVEYKNVKPSPDVPLHDAMESFRYENVELSNADLKRVGANMSSRIQLTVDMDGKQTRGVFTKRTPYDPVGQFRSLVGDMKTKYGKFESFWKAIDTPRFYQDGFEGAQALLFCNTSTGKVYDDTQEAKNTAMRNFSVSAALNLFPQAQAEYNKYRNDPDFFNALFDFSVKADQLNTARGINGQLLGLKPGDNIDGRNSAMSSVANLLGVGNLIAKSKQLSVHMPDGSNQTGTFMEFVEAKDITHVDSIDEMRVYGLEAYEGKEAKEQLANLQVLDYVCGNVDRHLGNMLYNFDPETHKLTGIKGIDNDASFLKERLAPEDGRAHLASIHDLRVIDEKMAEKLLSIDEGMLAATLHGYGLSQEEVDAAYDRLHNLQEAVRNAPTYDPQKGLPPYDPIGKGYDLTIVKSEDWDKLSLKELEAGNNNFSKIIQVQRTLTNIKMVTQPMIQAAECSKRSLKSMLSPENSANLLAKAQSHKPMFGVSDRYQNVLNAMEAYQNAPSPEDPLHSDGHEKWQRLVDLKRAVDTYKSEKIELGHLNRDGSPSEAMKGKALSRIEDVDKIGKFADKLIEQRQQALKDDKTLRDAERKQGELDAFKALPPEEQQIILDQRKAHEQYLKEDLSLRIQNSLAEEEHPMEASEDLDFQENLSMDAMDDPKAGMN